MKKTVIEFKNVSKIFRLYKGERQKIKCLFSDNVRCKEITALTNGNFKISQGERVALLGEVGSGKTTILKMIQGVSFPTKGKIIVDGKLAAIMELQAGFEPEFTGRENIRFRCQLYGLTNEEINKIEGDIVDFAQMGYYIDQPLRTYNNIMKQKLGYAINVSIHPDILIADEVISVGNVSFKHKCTKKIKELTENDKITFLFATHSPKSALKFCTRGIYISKGKILFDGDIEEAVRLFKEERQKDSSKKLSVSESIGEVKTDNKDDFAQDEDASKEQIIDEIIMESYME